MARNKAEGLYLRETAKNASLYDSSELPAKEVRERIRRHNLPIIESAGRKLSAKPWQRDRLRYAELPRLWCNEENPPPDANRFALRWEVAGTVLPEIRLEIFDRRSRQQAARRKWLLQEERSRIVITSSSLTTIGYEGNGFGQSLLGLSNLFIESVLHHLERWDIEDIARVDGKVVYAMINDMSVSSKDYLYGWERAKLRDQQVKLVDTKRRRWTSDFTERLLPNYTNDPEEVRRLLGFMPPYFSNNNFFARYDWRAYGNLPAEEYIDGVFGESDKAP